MSQRFNVKTTRAFHHDRIYSTKQRGTSKERNLERRTEYQTESKAFAKSTVARTVRAPGLDWRKESAIDCERRRT